MLKLGELIISGMEVYALPQRRAVHHGDPLEVPHPPRRLMPLLSVLLHTAAVGGLPLPWLGGRR